MKLVLIKRLLAGAVLMTSTLAVPAPALAQRVLGPGPGPVPVKTITLPCCRCLDGTTVTIKVSTGAVPWTVTTPGASAVTAVAASNPAWVLPSNPAFAGAPPAAWVGAPGGIETPGPYTFQMPFNVPKCIIPMQVKISGKFAADNSGQLYVGTNLVASSQGTPSYGFLPGSVTPFNWTGTLVPGPNAINFVVSNEGGPTGAIVAATITVTCPREAVRKD